MKRILLGLAVAALAAGTAAADPGGFAPPAPAGGFAMPTAAPTGNPNDTLVGYIGSSPNRPPDRYGMLPGLRRLFTLDKPCSTCKECGGGGLFHKSGCGHGLGHGGGGGGGYGPGMAGPTVNQGTLVFPHHTFVRSPRDFFMYEPGR